MATVMTPSAPNDVETSSSDLNGKPPASNATRAILSSELVISNSRRTELKCHCEVPIKESAMNGCTFNRLFRQPREEEVLLQLEADDPQRRMLADAWSKLAQNTALRDLSVNKLVPLWTSAFHSSEFCAMLHRLQSLHIDIFGFKEGYRSINTEPSYVDALQSMLKVLFLHCRSLESLSLHAPQQAPLGARGPYHIPLSLKAIQLPSLRHLSLKNCFIGFELAHFINGHADTLASLELHNCYSHRCMGKGDASSGISWATFLTLIARPATKLQNFVVTDRHIPLTIDDKRLEAYNIDTADEPEDVKGVRRAQMQNSKLRLFLYGYLRDYSGELWMNKEAILASFDNKDDQEAFDQLMGVIRKNCQTEEAGKDGVISEKTQALHVEVVELPASSPALLYAQ